MRIFRSITARVWVLVGLVFIGFMGVLAYTIWYDERDDVAFAQLGVSKLADQTAGQYEHQFQELENLSGILSSQPGIFEPGSCESQVKNFITFHPEIIQAAIVLPSGEQVCSFPTEPGAPSDVSGEAWFQSASRSPVYQVSQPFQDPASGDWMLETSYPYFDSQDRLSGFVSFQFNLERFQQQISSQLLPDHSIISLIDAHGNLVFQSASTSPGEQLVALDNRLIDSVLTGVSGSMLSEDQDHVKRLYGAASISRVGWRVYAGIPFDFIYAHTRRVMPKSLLAVLLVTGSLVVITYFVANRIVQPIHALSEIVKQAGEGRMGANLPFRGPEEIAEIARRFNALFVARSLSENALRGSQMRLTEIISTAMDAIISIDQEQKIFLFNAAAERVFRCQAADVVGKSLDILIPERYRQQHVRYLDQFGLTGQTNRSMGGGTSLFGLRMNGEEFPMEASISQGRLGDQCFYTVILRDITDRIQAMSALRSSEERFRRLAENAPSIILRFHYLPEFIYEYISPAVSGITGYSPEEFYANPALGAQLVLEQDKPIFEHLTQGDIHKSETLEMRWRCKDGAIIWTEHHYTPVWSEDGELASVEGIIIDISDRKRSEQELRKAEAKTRAILDAMPDMMFQIAPTGELVDYRARKEADLIMPPEKFLGVSFRQVLPEAVHHQLEAVMRKTWRFGQALSFEYQLTTQDGKLKDFEARVSQTAMGDFLVIARNITERKQSELDLKQAYLDLEQAYDATIEGWSKALELRDRETNGHTLRVAETTMRLASSVGIPESELVHVYRGALLHDIGKMAVPDRILFKPGPLTKEEWELMRKHPIYAYNMLQPIEYLRGSLNIPLCHHEKWDGSGYPQGLRGEQIPIEARVFSVVDVWDALSSERPYHAAWSMEKTLNYFRSQSGKHFDPSIVKALFRFLKETGQQTPDQGHQPRFHHLYAQSGEPGGENNLPVQHDSLAEFDPHAAEQPPPEAQD